MILHFSVKGPFLAFQALKFSFLLFSVVYSLFYIVTSRLAPRLHEERANAASAAEVETLAERRTANMASNSDLQDRIKALEAENAALKSRTANGGNIRFKVSQKGALSVYGLNARFPVTLYADQWTRLIAEVPALQKFIADNKANLTTKS